jgi:hypothetical protein
MNAKSSKSNTSFWAPMLEKNFLWTILTVSVGITIGVSYFDYRAHNSIGATGPQKETNRSATVQSEPIKTAPSKVPDGDGIKSDPLSSTGAKSSGGLAASASSSGSIPK